MKTWPLIIGIIVILVVVGSPALAISKSDLISYYKGQSVPMTPTPTSTPTSFPPSPFVIPPPTPSQNIMEPRPGVGSISVNSNPPGADVFLDGQYQGITPFVIRDIPINFSMYPGCQWVIITLTRTGYKKATATEILCNRIHRTISITLTPNQTTQSEYCGEDNYAPWSRTKKYIAF